MPRIPPLIALNRSNVEVALVPGKQERQLVGAGGAAPALGQIDVIFPIVHGTLGEDGSLQGTLRLANLPSSARTCWARRCAWTRP